MFLNTKNISLGNVKRQILHMFMLVYLDLNMCSFLLENVASSLFQACFT